MGKNLSSPEKYLIIDNSIVVLLSRLKEEFLDDDLNEYLIININEKHCDDIYNSCNVDLKLVYQFKNFEVSSGSHIFTIMVQERGCQPSDISPRFIACQNSSCSYPILGFEYKFLLFIITLDQWSGMMFQFCFKFCGRCDLFASTPLIGSALLS